MASISPLSYQCAAEPWSGKNAYLKFEITSISDSDATTNQRYVGWKVTFQGTPYSYFYGAYITLGGHVLYNSHSASAIKTSWYVGTELCSGSETFGNDSAGNLTLYSYMKQAFYYGMSDERWNNNSYCQIADCNFVCSQLPRYANFTSHYVSGTGINTLSVHWEVDASCDFVQRSLNGGAWTNDAYWPDYTLGGLAPGTQYNVRTRVRRTDSQLWTESGYIYGTTKNLPSSNTPNNFNIFNSPTASISSMNYLDYWYVHLYDGSTMIKDSGQVKSASAVQDVSDSTLVDGMLKRHPNENSWPITFNYYCVSNSLGYQIESRTCQCSIPSGQYLPTFNENNISYVVTDEQSLNLTGSNKKVIKGISDVKITCTPASPNGHASITSYSANSGNSTNSTKDTASPIIDLYNVNGNSITVQAIDSRNRSTSVTKAFDTFIDYFAPSFTSALVSRLDGVSPNLMVDITGKYCDWTGLSTTNLLKQVSIQYKKKTDSAYTTIPNINFTITNSNGIFNVSGIINGNYFSATEEYDLLLMFSDKITNLPYYTSIPTGKALLWRDLLNSFIGIGKKPTCQLDVEGAIKVSRTSWNYNNAALIGSKEEPHTTVQKLIDTLRYTNGQIGSVQITENYVKDGITIPATWYNYVYIPHRFGTDTGTVLSDTVNRDNHMYGNLILYSMTNNMASYTVKLQGGVIASIRSAALDAYPVGSIYITASPNSPASTHGGTWTRLRDRFLYATGSENVNKGKDGLSSHAGPNVTGTAINQNQMPSHSHSFTTFANGQHQHRVYLNGDNSFPFYGHPGWNGEAVGNAAKLSCGSGSYNGYPFTAGHSSGGDGAHQHTGNVDWAGGSQAHEHGVSYIEVYAWQRIS